MSDHELLPPISQSIHSARRGASSGKMRNRVFCLSTEEGEYGNQAYEALLDRHEAKQVTVRQETEFMCQKSEMLYLRVKWQEHKP